jgi:putative tricarboxylic transport membrane protein
MTAVSSLVRGRSELGIAALLGAVAAVITIDTTLIRRTAVSTAVIGPQVVPAVVAGGLALCAIALAIDVLRGGHAAPEEGEDVDLSAGAHWPTLLGLAGTILASAVLMDYLGFVVSSGLMFSASALLLGSRRYVWTLVVGAVLSVVTFYGFVLGLGIHLPAGVLTGIL